MPHEISEDWKPLEECTPKDQGKAFGKMREQYPVAHSNFLGWSGFRRKDIEAVEVTLRVDGPLGNAFSAKADVHSYGDVALMMTALSENVQRD